MQVATKTRRSTGENPAIQLRRELDDKMMQHEAIQKADEKRMFVAAWQAKSAAQVEKLQIQNIAKQLEIAAQQKVEQRRQRLAELLALEEEQYAREIAAGTESIQDKLQRNLAIAKQHKQAREEKRREFAQQELLRMWRAGCDDLRTLSSEANDRYVKDMQLRQREEKRLRAEAEKKEDEIWTQLWEEDRKQKIARETEEAAKRSMMILETRAAVIEQMRDRENRRNAELLLKEQERQEWQARMELEAAKAEEEKQARIRELREQGRKVAAWNAELMERKREERRLKDLEDKKIIEAQLADYEEELKRKRLTKEAMQKEMVAYKAFLQARREEERKLEEELDRITQAHLDASNAKQDALWERERQARERLMQEVDRARKEQLEAKQRAKEEERAKAIAERQALEAELAHDAKLQAEEERQRKIQELRQKIDLELQIRERANQRAIEQARVRAELEEARLAEAQYRQFVQSEMERLRSLAPEQQLRARDRLM